MPLTTLDPNTALIVVEYSITNVFPKLGETGTAQDVIDLLATTGVRP